jgi:hypothetical protein
MLQENFQKTNGKQPGDPVKGVRRLIEAVTHEGLAQGKRLPARVALGKDAYERVGSRLARFEKEKEEWKEWTNESWRDDIDSNLTLA